MMSLSQDKFIIGWGEPHRVLAKEIDPSKPAFYLTDFFLTNHQPWIQYSHWTEISSDELHQKLNSPAQLPVCNWTIHQPEQFKKAFDELSHLLQTTPLQKGVPYLFAHSASPMDQERLQFCLKRSLVILKQKQGYLYGHWHLSSGILGITPELLFSHIQHQPRKVHTMALAGTCSSSRCLNSFLKDEKEQDEHQLVIQGICHSLQSLGKLQIGETQLLRLPKLTHFMTPIEIELNHPFDFDTLLSYLHPTPALGAFPLHEGRMWLQNFQKHTPRHYYGAPVGFQYPQKGLSQCFVGIRNVQWDKCGMRIGAGCGVVKKSTFEKEWQEVQLKIQAIQDQLCL